VSIKVAHRLLYKDEHAYCSFDFTCLALKWRPISGISKSPSTGRKKTAEPTPTLSRPGGGSARRSLSVPFVLLIQEVWAKPPQWFQKSTLATGPIADPPGAVRIGVCGGQHTEQGSAPARAGRPATAADPGNGPGPFKSIMQRCDFL
jgi:hypothetical protein